MGTSCFCPRSPESEALLKYDAKQFTRYEIVLHRPPPKDWLIIKNVARDEFVVEKVNYYILKEWRVKSGHLLRRVAKDPVSKGLNPIRAMDKKKYPLKIMFAKRRKVETPPSDDESEDISRESFVSLKGSKLYELPAERNLRSLNNRDLLCKSEELEAALKNLTQKFKKDRRNYVEKAKKYKEKDQEQRNDLIKKVKESERKVEKANLIAGGASVASSATSMSQKNLDISPEDGKESGVFEGYLFKYGKQGSKAPKRKWVKFYIGPPTTKGNLKLESAVILQYADNRDAFDNPSKITEFIVKSLMEDADSKSKEPLAVQKTQFGVWVADEKEKQKGIVFSSENELSKRSWVQFIRAILDQLKTHGEAPNIFLTSR